MRTMSTHEIRAQPQVICQRVLNRWMAVACYVFPLLYLGSAVFLVLNPGVFHPEPYEWMASNDVEQFGLLWLAWFVGVAAMLEITCLLATSASRLVGWAAMIFVGGLVQVGWILPMLQRTALQRIPFEPNHTMLLVEQSPIFLWSFVVLFWMVGLIMVGFRIWRTVALPQWMGRALVTLNAPAELPEIPAAVEAVVFRIVQYL